MNVEMFLDKGWEKSITRCAPVLKKCSLKRKKRVLYPKSGSTWVSDPNVDLLKRMKSTRNTSKCINRWKDVFV